MNLNNKTSLSEDNHYDRNNLQLLKKFHPTAKTIIASKNNICQGKLYTAADGFVNGTITHKGSEFPLHKNHQQETDYCLASIKENVPIVVCFIGMGLGYAALRVIKNRPNIQKLIIFEPLLQSFALAIHGVDLSTLLTDPRVIIHLGKGRSLDQQVLAPALQALQVENSYIHCHTPAFAIDHDLYENLRQQVYAFCNHLNISGATIMAVSQLLMQNRFANLTNLTNIRLFDDLQNIYQNRPVIVVTAGPSLDKNIHLLAEIKDKVCIIAADSAFPALRKHNITPHFITSLDPKDILFEKLGICLNKTNESNLICSTANTPKIQKYFPFKQTFLTFNNSNMENWFNRLLGGRITVSEADSSPHLALVAALTMKASPIIFIGHDLAYSNHKMHADGTVLTSELLNTEQNNPENNPDLFWIKSITNKKLLTSRGFKLSKQHFEQIIANHPDHHYINATEDGAGLDGTEIRSLKDTIRLFCKETFNPQIILENHLASRPQPAVDSLLTTFQQTAKTVKELLKLNSTASALTINLLTRLHKLNSAKINRINHFTDLSKNLQNQLKKHDNIGRQIRRQDKIWSLLDEVTLIALRDSNRLFTEISLIADTPVNYLARLIKTVAITKLINKERKKALVLFGKHLNQILSFYKKLKTAATAAQLMEIHLAADNIEQAKLLARQILKEENSKTHNYTTDGKIDFNLGCIAVKQINEKMAASHFHQAVAANPGLASEIKKFETAMQTEFQHLLQIAPPKVQTSLALRQLYFFGRIGLSPNQLDKIYSDEIKTIDTAAITLSMIKKSLALAHALFADELTRQGKMGGAAEALKLAAEFDPQDAELQIKCVQAYFILEEFDSALTHLRQAVQLNPAKALHWEEIGDDMWKAGLWDEAAAAYENCYLVIPARFDLLKKMGDCFQQAGKLEAAREAYEQYKLQIVDG